MVQNQQKLGLENSLNRGVTVRRIIQALKEPLLAVRNIKFLHSKTISCEQHVFVIGPPRSGTTLMQSLIRAHSDFCGLEEETRFFFRRNFLSIHYPEVRKEELSQLLADAKDMIDLFDKIAITIKEKQKGRRFIEKTPEHALMLRYLSKHFPESKFVFTIRDPRDGFLSARRNPRVKVASIPMYSEIWGKSVQSYINAEASGTKILLVPYEELCKNPQEKLNVVMNFLGVQLEDEQLNQSNYSKTRIKNLKGHQRLAERISDSSVGQWKGQLTEEELQEFESRLGPLMRKMGYPNTPVRNT